MRLTELRPNGYDARLEQIKQRLEQRVLDLFKVIRRDSEPYVCSTVQDTTGTETEWTMYVHLSPLGQKSPEDWNAQALTVSLSIEESFEHDGLFGGINFSLEFAGETEYVRVCPFNFTPEVWVDMNDDVAIDQRFAEVVANVEDASGMAIDRHQETLAGVA